MAPKKQNRLRGPRSVRSPEKMTLKNIDRKLEEMFTPTEKHLHHEFTEDELKELCLRVPCAVDMTRWNSVHDYVLRFTRENRLDRRTPEQRIRLLERAVNKTHKEHGYTLAEIQEDRERFWKFRKFENFLQLKEWKDEAIQKANKGPIQTYEISSEDESGEEEEYVVEIGDEDVVIDEEECEYEILGEDNEDVAASVVISNSNDDDDNNNNLSMTCSKSENSDYFAGMLAEILPSSSEEMPQMTAVAANPQLLSSQISSPAEPDSQSQNSANFEQIAYVYNQMNTASMTFDSGSNSVLPTQSQSSSNPTSQEILGDFAVHSEDFMAIPLTATSTQELK